MPIKDFLSEKWASHAELHEVLGIFDRQLFEKLRVVNAEYGSVATDPEGQGEEGHRCVARCTPEDAYRETNVLHQLTHRYPR